MLQRNTAALRAEVFTFSGTGVRELTEASWRVMSRGRFKFWKNAGVALQNGERWDLEREMREAVRKIMSYGERLDHSVGGYSDRLISVAMAIWKLEQRQMVPGIVVW